MSAQFDLGTSGRIIQAATEEGRRALVGYYPVGFPDVATSFDVMSVLAEGCDLIEIGMPYSDPVMDGPVIETAGTRALAAGVRTRDLFTAAEKLSERGASSVIMTYWNIIERYGVDAFARDLAAAGAAGVITPDLIPEEAEEWIAASEAHGLDRVFLVSPSSSDERIVSTVASCRGWLYATSVMGVTGVRARTSSAAPRLVSRIWDLCPEVPIGIGLGVSNGEQARETAEFADAVIVGSALLRTMLKSQDEGRPSDTTELAALVEDLAAGVRA